MWRGDCSHAGLVGLPLPVTIHLAASSIDQLLTKGPKEVIGSRLTVTLLASGSFGGPLNDDSEWVIGAAPLTGSGWLSLNWILSASYGGHRELKCLLRALGSENGDLSLEILFPSEATGFAPRPVTPAATKKAMRELKQSGSLVHLERDELPTVHPREVKLGTSMHRAVCGLFKASLKVFEASLLPPTAAASPAQGRTGSRDTPRKRPTPSPKREEEGMEELNREARERYGVTIDDGGEGSSRRRLTAPADTLCVRIWHLKAEIELPADALWTVLRFRVLLHKLFREWPLLRDAGAPRDDPEWLYDLLETEEDDHRMERLAGDGFDGCPLLPCSS